MSTTITTTALRRYCFSLVCVWLGSLPAWAQQPPLRPSAQPQTQTAPPAPAGYQAGGIQASTAMIPYRCEMPGAKRPMSFTGMYLFNGQGPAYTIVRYGNEMLEFHQAQPLNDVAYVFTSPNVDYQWMVGFKEAQLVRLPKGNETRGPIVMTCTAKVVTTLLQPATYAKFR